MIRVPSEKGDVNAMIRRYLQRGQTAVDVGAAHGDMTDVMLDCVGPAGAVIAIEPDQSKGRLLKLASHHPNLELHWVGAGESYGTMPLFRPGTTQASRWHGDGTEQGGTPAESSYAPLDAIIGDRPVDLVKLDTQGSEAHILDGAAKLLTRCPVWIVELWPWGLFTANRTVFDVIGAFRKAGFVSRWANGTVIDEDALDEFHGAPGGERNGQMRNITATLRLEVCERKHWNIYATAHE